MWKRAFDQKNGFGVTELALGIFSVPSKALWKRFLFEIRATTCVTKRCKEIRVSCVDLALRKVTCVKFTHI